ncbi:putative glutamine amidotransferase [Anaerobranca californiensis DSM 14826]|uniref:Putative glutamine amidotransferase n=1 Tax=Anaerobranca californiensis DSM 14826 TaxID=1120989 RepID=A0A1M6QQI4_9FIRM|nr:gamma-glutamyl-gamma-aminobutyrate hydrolase family protein [Anaerobranca californiensis]SHK22542.1 putative glutamine amidotransferase [Anaerobranca californiensis DSM 14826]
MKPVIGITAIFDYNLNRNWLGDDYITAVVEGGGIPVIIPSNIKVENIPQLITKIDGLLLSGGDDVNPLIFGEQPHPKLGDVDPLRDILEIHLVKTALEKKKPILGICRGLQVTNVALGGTILQDIFSQREKVLGHRQKGPRFYLSHQVYIEKDTLLANVIGKTEVLVNSFHHQSIGVLGENLLINCRSSDGIIEGIESYCGNILAVQWHPENLWRYTDEHIKLFKWLVDKSK